MQVICPISGIELIRAPYMLGLAYEEVHPIFRLSRKDLITPDLVHKFTVASSLEEKSLYFLAVCHSTDLIDFSCIAHPSIDTCEKNFITVMAFAGWMDYAAFYVGGVVSFPKFVVRGELRHPNGYMYNDLSNLYIWVKALEEVRQEYLDKNKDRELSKRLQTEHQTLLNELSAAWQKGRMFTPKVAKWVLEKTGLDKHPQGETFYKMLICRNEDACGLPRDTLLYLKEQIVDRLDMNHSLFTPILGQLNNLIKETKKTPTFEILYEVQDIEVDGVIERTKVDIFDAAKARLLAATGKEGEPQLKDFANEFGKIGKKEEWKFQVAKASWKLLQMNASKQQSEV